MTSHEPRVLALTTEKAAFEDLAREVGSGFRTSRDPEGESVEAPDGPPGTRWNLVLVDSQLCDGQGYGLAIDLAKSGQRVILVSRTPSLDLTVRAHQAGLLDVVAFPPEGERILAHIEGEVESAGSLPLEILGEEDALLGADERMIEVFRLIARAASTREHLLIQGEVGVGKATLARLLHRHGGHTEGDFVELSVGVLSEGLLESELFGHEEGTFPWAIAARKGRLERAHGGTLFLDDVHLLPTRLQLALLQVLVEKRVQHVGGREFIPADFRLVAASPRSLMELVDAGEFLEDFYQRVSLVSVTIPPLRDRGDDVALLARHFGAMAARRYEREVTRISPEALDKLRRHEWPGNVRELRQVMNRAVLVADGSVIEARHLPDTLQWPSRLDREALGLEEGSPASLDELEAAHIRRVVRTTEGNLTQAAEILEIHRNTLRRKLDKYRIPT